MDPRVARLLKIPQTIQKSEAWLKQRSGFITASSASNLLIRDKKTCGKYVELFGLEDTFAFNGKCCNPYSSKNQYFLDKCRGSTFKGNIATYHGQKYEQVVVDIYSVLYKTPVLEFGLIPHPEISWLAASPDGITPEGVMIEIKCPYRRKINGVVPLQYYIQVQLQMEATNLEVCDFLEYEFTEFTSEEEWLDEETLGSNWLNRGLFIQVEKLNDLEIFNPEDNEYIYPEKELIDDVDALLGWTRYQLTELPKAMKEEFLDKLKITVVYWKVPLNSIIRIERDQEWFANVKPVFEKEWAKVGYYRKGENWKQLVKEKAKDIDGSVLHVDTTECIL